MEQYMTGIMFGQLIVVGYCLWTQDGHAVIAEGLSFVMLIPVLGRLWGWW